jgi:hypothetical protein
MSFLNATHQLILRSATTVWLLSTCLHAFEEAGSVVPIDFSRQIRPVLAKQCFSCHGSGTQESGVALHEFERSTAKSDSGVRPIVPNDANASEIIKRITSDDPALRMPPEGPGLTETQVHLVREWIQQGAEYREHWAFLPLSNPRVPAVTVGDSGHPFNEIDAFIQHRLDQQSLPKASAADPRALIRRLYFDCLGVPPTFDTVESFAAEPSDAAYEKMVDELLSDPRFGERMARNWLDVVRYAETNSFERDGLKPNAWKYRDYVIRSFNEDKPYDQFLMEQLAGDELEKPTPESLTATGFYRLGIWDDEPADPAKARYDEFDDLVTTIGQGMLGLTFNCARCHDHKIDPIPQKDYYQLVAFLRDVTSYGRRSDETSNNQIDVSEPSISARNRQLKRSIANAKLQMKQIEEDAIAKMSSEDKVAAKGPDRNKAIKERLKGLLTESEWAHYISLKDGIESATSEQQSLPIDFRLGLAKCEPTPEKTFVLMRGTPEAHGDEVELVFPKLFDEPNLPQPKPRSDSSGRRLELAKWITSPNNRLTGRVVANRLWQHHFGRGIVRSSNNFGQLGDPPTHPELLDFLAQKLIGFNWRQKPLHRMILLSDTYRMSTIADKDTIARDPANDLFTRFNPRRLSAEELRDAVLTINNRISWVQTGPSFYPDVSDDVKAGQSVPGKGWGKSAQAEKARRSIYIHIKRSLIPPELSVFDFPETDTSCEARFLTTQAAQAMNMLNGQFMQSQADHFAKELSTRTRSTEDALRLGVETAYSRPTTSEELERLSLLMKRIQSKFGLDRDQALREVCLVLLNSNEFLYLD